MEEYDGDVKARNMRGYKSLMTDDLTATTHKEATMATNDVNETTETTEVPYEVYEVGGSKGVDRNTAMAIIGFNYPNELKNYVDHKKIHVIGEVQVRGKTNKKIFKLEDVLRAQKEHRTRGSDAPERFEIEIHGNVLNAAIKQLEDIDPEVIPTHVVTLLKALKEAKNLTEARREYNKAKKA